MVKIDIITYCSGYNYNVFNRFIGTLQDTGFSGNIYIIINNCDINIFNLLLENYKNIYAIMDNLHKSTHINCHRFLVIKKFLNMNPSPKLNDYILLCDSRDVLFQKNIENYDFDNLVDIYGFTEANKFDQDLIYNTRWIKQLEYIIKEDIYKKISHLNIICCGTTILKENIIKKYIDYMCEIIIKYKIKTNLDQGIHNYILYLNKLNLNIKLLSNKDNLVNTVGFSIHKFDKDNNIVNSLDDVSYVVHQYDRFSLENKQKINDKFLNKYDFVK